MDRCCLQYGGASVTHATINGDSFPADAFFSGTYPDPVAGDFVITLTAAPAVSFDGNPTTDLGFTVPQPLTAGDCAATASRVDVTPTPPIVRGAQAPCRHSSATGTATR